MNSLSKTTKSKFDIEAKKSYFSSPPRFPNVMKETSTMRYSPKGNSSISNCFTYNMQNITPDIDKLREELMNIKIQSNKKNKEFNILKISYNKLEEEYKRITKLLNEITEEAQRKGYDSDIGYNLSQYSLNKLKESNIITNLKKQLNENKILLNMREEELNNLKSNSKVSKFHELENKLYQYSGEYNVLSEKFNYLRNAYGDKEIKSQEAIDERDHYKNLMYKYKNQYEECKAKLIDFQEKQNKMNDTKKILEDKNSMLKFQINSLRSQVRERENDVINTKRELEELETFKYDKERFEKDFNSNQKMSQSMKDDIDRKNKRIKELEKMVNEFNSKLELIEQQKRDSPKEQNILNNTHKEKDKKIKQIENENSSLKDELNNDKNKISELEYEVNRLNETISDQTKLNDKMKNEIDGLKKGIKDWEECYEDLDEKYKRILREYVDYQEDMSYKLEKLEKKNDISSVSKFNIKKGGKKKKEENNQNKIEETEEKKDIQDNEPTKKEKLLVTELPENEDDIYNNDFEKGDNDIPNV